MQDGKTFLGTQPIKKLLPKLAVPTVIAQLVNMLYNIVDRIYIGHIPEVGSLALTGIGVCMPLILIVSAFSAFVASGGAPRASIFMGRGDGDSAEKTLGCLTMQAIISLLLTAAMLIWKDELLYLFGASENTISYAADYMGIYALGTIFVQIKLGLYAFITAQGFAKVGMKTVIIGAVLNIVLDPVFIFAFGMGVKGAALATVISQAVSCAWVISFLCGSKTVLRAVPVQQKKRPEAARAELPAEPAAHPALRGPRHGDVYHAGERERHIHVLQHLPAALRRRYRSRRNDDTFKRHAVCNAAASGRGAGRAAYNEL